MKTNTRTKHQTPCACEICNAQFPPVPADGGASGYALTREGKYICYTCADARQREDLKDRSKSFVAYVSSDGRSIITWTGGKLMDVTQSWPCQLTRPSHWHDSRSYRCIRARDVHGAMWHGRGSAGIAIKMRPMKGGK